MKSNQFASLAPVREELIAAVLGLVPNADAELLRRRYLDGANAAELANELGVTVAGLDQRTTRVKRRLREALETRPDLVEELHRGHPHIYS